MIYIIQGDEPYLINKKINEIIKKNGGTVNRISTAKDDLRYHAIIESCTGISLFADSSLTLVRDPDFLIGKDASKDLTDLFEYCANPLYESDLVFYTLSDSFNGRLSVYKTIAKNAEVIKLNRYRNNDFVNYCYARLREKGLNIDRKSAGLLVEKAGGSITLFENNLEVLELYPDNIDLRAADALSSDSFEENVFELINALICRNLTKALKVYRRNLSSDGSIFGLISLIASQLRFLYEISYYRDLGFNNKLMMEKTNSKSSYRIEKALESLNGLKKKDIHRLLYKLSLLEENLKTTGDISDKEQFELFVLEFLR